MAESPIPDRWKEAQLFNILLSYIGYATAADRRKLQSIYPWGNALSCKHAVTMTGTFFSTRTCAAHPLPVGTHPAGASGYGVQDMIGNVSEWTQDWYAERTVGPAPRAGAAHVLRGGGWLTEPQMARTASHDWASALEAGPNVGFRCARDESPSR